MKAPKKTRIKKHKPAKLKYTIRNFEEYKILTQNDNTKAFVYMNLIHAVKNSLDQSNESLDLLELTDLNSIITLPRDKWKPTLNRAMEFFSDYELFETCAECKKLIDSL